MHVQVWFDGSRDAGKTGLGWWAAVKSNEEDVWRPVAAGCAPGLSVDALGAEREAAGKAIELLRALSSVHGGWLDWRGT